MVHVDLTPEEEELKKYVFSERHEFKNVLVGHLKNILSKHIYDAMVDFYGVTVNVSADKVYIDGYLALSKLGDNTPTHIIEMHIVIHSDLTMEFRAGPLWFDYDLRNDVKDLLDTYRFTEMALQITQPIVYTFQPPSQQNSTR